jgi:hypothetical protein
MKVVTGWLCVMYALVLPSIHERQLIFGVHKMRGHFLLAGELLASHKDSASWSLTVMSAPDSILMFSPYSFFMSDEFSHKTLCDMMKSK